MDLKDIKLLFVEDEEGIVDAMEKILAGVVSELHIAKDGEEGYELYKKFKPDIILSDISMPKVSGIELVRKIREKDQNVKVILLTAHSDRDLLIEATELKLTKYLMKPVLAKELFEAFNLAVEEIRNLNIEYKKLVHLNNECYWDMGVKTLYQGSNEIRLTPKEKAVLGHLLEKQNSVRSYDDIIYEIWEDSDSYCIDTLKSTVKSLRKKLPVDCIKNVYGTGYKIEI